VDKLKPCPFCGSKEIDIVDHDGQICVCDKCGSGADFKTWNKRFIIIEKEL
jgi:RNA polymerase subunit RPABC4/transcription elongation factor Spt4